MNLRDLRNVPFTLNTLGSIYPNIKSLSNKAIDLENKDKILRLKRGLYVVSPNESGIFLSESVIANHIYGPSYVSMETALRYYGLIPERIKSVRSMTIKHTRCFDNDLGHFEYVRCDLDYFRIGIEMRSEEDANFLIASSEKALCDLLLTMPTSDIRFKHELYTFLEDNLRFDMQAFHSMRKEIFEQCASIGKKSQLLTNLIKLL